MRTSFHHQPEAQHPNFQLSTSWQADYPIFRGEADMTELLPTPSFKKSRLIEPRDRPSGRGPLRPRLLYSCEREAAHRLCQLWSLHSCPWASHQEAYNGTGTKVRTKSRNDSSRGGDCGCDHNVGRSSDPEERFSCADPASGSDLPTSAFALVLRSATALAE
jgi:hypothetical protein